MNGRKPSATRERGYIYNHGLRVANMALMLLDSTGGKLGTARNIVFAGALFHDVAKGIPSHADVGAEWVITLLRKSATKQEAEQIAFIVRNHNNRGHTDFPVYIHAVQDADVLDKVGGQMAWRAFHFSAYQERDPALTVEYYFGKEHQLYLRMLSDSLNLKKSRKVFASRLKLQDAFFERFREEVNGGL